MKNFNVNKISLKIAIMVILMSSSTLAMAQQDIMQSSDVPIDQGVLTSWDNITNSNMVNINVFADQKKDIPINYEIDKVKLQNIKKKPFAPSGNITPNNEKDNSPVHGSVPKLLTPTTPTTISSFEGLSNLDQTSGYIFIPPDPTIAVGPNNVGTVVNTEFAFYYKNGTLVKKTNFEKWFSNVFTVCSNCVMSDPKITYADGHWIMMILGIDFGTQNSWYLVSVSKTSDPTGTWKNYKITSSLTFNGIKTWSDYPDLGFDSISSANGGAIYITSNNFDFSPGYFQTSLINVIPKSILYNFGTVNSTNYKRFYGNKNLDGSQAFTIRTSQTFGSSNGEYLINDKSYGGSSVTLWKITPNVNPITLTRVADIPIGSYSPPPDAKQSGNCGLLDTIDNRMFNAVYQNGNLYTAFAESYNWGNGTVAAIRYMKINTTSKTASINSRYGEDKAFYWFPAISVDKSNNITMVFAKSSLSQYSGIYYAGRKTTDPWASWSKSLKGGQECITGNRWGDYFGIGRDPSNGNRMWIYGEYSRKIGISSVWDWGTYVGQLSN